MKKSLCTICALAGFVEADVLVNHDLIMIPSKVSKLSTVAVFSLGLSFSEGECRSYSVRKYCEKYFGPI